MRSLSLIVVLALGLAVPVAAQPSYELPYDLTLSDGTVTGTFGGVPVTGTYTGTTSGSFTLQVDGADFVTGTYSCTSSGCTFTGTTVAGITKTFTFTSPTDLTMPVTGAAPGVFANHGGWVSAVAHWAHSNLTTLRVGEVVRAAASIKGKKASTSAEEAHGKGKAKGHNK